jgi:DNA-directed RNA polymerase specialized sigma24 family protein
VVAVNVYQVTARRWAHGWELHIHDDAGDEIGVTQSRSLAGAKRMVCDYLALDLGGEPEYYDVTITPELNGNLATEAEAARQAVRDAEQAQRDAAARQRAVARHLKESGLSGTDIAAVLKVSTQRVSQLVNS